MASYCEVMPWYCCTPGKYWFESCVPDANQQSQMMSFGENIDPSLAEKARTDTKGWLDSINYNGAIKQAIEDDKKNLFPSLNLPDISGYMPLLIAIGVIGLVSLGSGGARRYGR